MKGSETKIRAVRAFIGVAIRNLNALSADDKEAMRITSAVNDAEMILARCYSELSERLTASLSKEREGV